MSGLDMTSTSMSNIRRLDSTVPTLQKRIRAFETRRKQCWRDSLPQQFHSKSVYSSTKSSKMLMMDTPLASPEPLSAILTMGQNSELPEPLLQDIFEMERGVSLSKSPLTSINNVLADLGFTDASIYQEGDDFNEDETNSRAEGVIDQLLLLNDDDDIDTDYMDTDTDTDTDKSTEVASVTYLSHLLEHQQTLMEPSSSSANSSLQYLEDNTPPPTNPPSPTPLTRNAFSTDGSSVEESIADEEEESSFIGDALINAYDTSMPSGIVIKEEVSDPETDAFYDTIQVDVSIVKEEPMTLGERMALYKAEKNNDHEMASPKGVSPEVRSRRRRKSSISCPPPDFDINSILGWDPSFFLADQTDDSIDDTDDETAQEARRTNDDNDLNHDCMWNSNGGVSNSALFSGVPVPVSEVSRKQMAASRRRIYSSSRLTPTADLNLGSPSAVIPPPFFDDDLFFDPLNKDSSLSSLNCETHDFFDGLLGGFDQTEKRNRTLSESSAAIAAAVKKAKLPEPEKEVKVEPKVEPVNLIGFLNDHNYCLGSGVDHPQIVVSCDEDEEDEELCAAENVAKTLKNARFQKQLQQVTRSLVLGKNNGKFRITATHNKRNGSKTPAIQGIVIHEEDEEFGKSPNGVQKKTKILVPLKDLMETLQQKSFLVSPIGPGKKVIRLGNGETVRGVLGVPSFGGITSSQTSTAQQPVTSIMMKLPMTPPTTPTKHQRKRPHGQVKSTTMRSESPISSDGLILSPNMLMDNSFIKGSSHSGHPTKKKTKAHNNMERMRRIDLRNSFDNLRKLVPPLSKASKCSKVEILRRAEEYIRALRSQEKRLVKEEAAIKARHEQLKLKISSMSNNSSSSNGTDTCIE